MLKIMLKEPVGGMIKDGVAARASNYLEVVGTVNEFVKNVGKTDSNVWVQGISVSGEPVAVALGNIAFVIETK